MINTVKDFHVNFAGWTMTARQREKLKVAVGFSQAPYENNCGIDNIGSFYNTSHITGVQKENKVAKTSGSGLITASFNDEQEELLNVILADPHYKVLFKSNWYRNNNSGNQVCFLVLYHKDWIDTEPEEVEEDENYVGYDDGLPF